MKKSRYCVFYPKLYIGTHVRQVARIKWKLTHGAGTLRVFLIAEAPGMPDHIAILHAAYLQQSYYRDHPLMVYGIAAGYAEARDLVVKIMKEAGAHGYTGAPKAYLDRIRGDDT